MCFKIQTYLIYLQCKTRESFGKVFRYKKMLLNWPTNISLLAVESFLDHLKDANFYTFSGQLMDSGIGRNLDDYTLIKIGL